MCYLNSRKNRLRTATQFEDIFSVVSRKRAAGGELEETPRILFDDMRIKKNQNKKSFLGNFFYF